MSEWKDKFKRFGDSEPESAEARYGCFRLRIHHYIGYPGDVWFGSCHPEVFSCVELESTALEEAKRQAKALLQARLEEALRSLLA